MDLTFQIRLLSDEELLEQIAEFSGWFKVTQGASTWFTSGEYASDVASGKTLSLDHTIANAVANFDDEKQQFYVDYIENLCADRFEAIQASARIKAQAVLFAWTASIAMRLREIEAEQAHTKLLKQLSTLKK